MADKRTTLLLILAALVGGGLPLLAWTQTRVRVEVTGASATTQLSGDGPTA